jgi:hypothetical protein
MGNQDSSKTKVEVSNKINTEIQNITANINKVLNETCTTTVSNIVNENASKIKQSTAASNKMDLGDIELSGDADIDITQKADVQATSKAIITIISSMEQMSAMANQMAQDMANKLQNDNSMKASMEAAAKLKEAQKDAGGPEGMVNKIMDTIGNMTKMGSSSSNTIEQSIRNEINNKIINNTRNENEIKNIVKNHVENNIKKVNQQSCDIQVSGDNQLTFRKLKASGNSKLKITQTVLITAFNDCIVTAMDNTKLTSDITGLQTTKTSSDTANASKQESGMKSDTELTKEKENKSAVMESVDNLVDTAGSVAKSAISGGTIIMIVGLIAVAIVLVFFMKSPEAMAMAKDGIKGKKGGGLSNPYSILIILFLILLFTHKSKK